jgi:hypothetical protein
MDEFKTMTLPAVKRSRRTFRWSKEARDLVRDNLHAGASQSTKLIGRLAELSGNPRDACIRFACQLGLKTERKYSRWPEHEQQRLLRLIELYPVRETARRMRRSEFSIYAMLRRMGANAAMGKDGFTKYSLAALLHVRHEEVQRWIDKGWLPAHVEGTERLPRVVITGDDFSSFCKRHRNLVIGNRLSLDRLEFVRNFVFPPSHAELLPVREAKKERAAYESQRNGSSGGGEGDLELDDFPQKNEPRTGLREAA